MKKHVAVTLLVLTTLGVLRAHVDIERQDGGYFLSFQGKKHDVLGALENQSNTWLRRCAAVQALDAASLQGQAVWRAVENFSPPQSRQGRILRLLQHENWLLAELEFTALNPAVLLLQATPGPLHIVDTAVWSGSTAPWRAAPLIRRYLQARAPQAPAVLLDCFDPVGALFQ